jgi:hypothetical protein
MADKPYVNPFEDVHKKALAVRELTRKIREKEAAGRAKAEERKEAASDEENRPRSLGSLLWHTNRRSCPGLVDPKTKIHAI